MKEILEKNQILNLVVNLDRKDIKVSFKNSGKLERKGIKTSFSQEHSRSILLINEVAWCVMHMMPCQLVDNTQKLKPKQPIRTIIRLGPTPLKIKPEKNDSKDFIKRIGDVVSSTCTQAPART